MSSVSSPLASSTTEFLTGMLGGGISSSGTESSRILDDYYGGDYNRSADHHFVLDDTTEAAAAAAAATIHYSRPATIFAAVCAIIFTIVGIAGKLCLRSVFFSISELAQT